MEDVMSNFTPEYIQKVRVCSNLIEPPAHEVISECLDEIVRLNAYAMKLLSDETRMWHCDNCGEDFESYAKGKFEIPDATRQCPLCETGIARPKAWIMQERIDELTAQVESLTKALDLERWISVSEPPKLTVDNYKSDRVEITDGVNVSIGEWTENYDCDGYHWYDETSIVDNPTHWRPLPQLPEDVL
jgi:hypothetical protein